MASSAQTTVIMISCSLSIIGSSLVALTSLYPSENRKKPGKVLLFWLSISDLLTPTIYLVDSVLHKYNTNVGFCEFVSLVGIFAPVASFLWTDIIALYLYTVVVNGKSYSTVEWKTFLVGAHLIAWSIPLILIIAVGVTGHAGRGTEGPGWCWIKGSNSDDIFLWQLIGGKIVEWTSCLLILPVLYFRAVHRLVQLESNDIKYQQLTERLEHAADLDFDLKREREASTVKFESKFSKFYWKMAMVPLVFFVIRFWGSLQMVLNYFQVSSSHQWISILECAFDPSQGFFNAVLFVFTSADGRHSVRLGFKNVSDRYLYWLPSFGMTPKPNDEFAFLGCGASAVSDFASGDYESVSRDGSFMSVSSSSKLSFGDFTSSGDSTNTGGSAISGGGSAGSTGQWWVKRGSAIRSSMGGGGAGRASHAGGNLTYMYSNDDLVIRSENESSEGLLGDEEVGLEGPLVVGDDEGLSSDAEGKSSDVEGDITSED